MQFDRELTRPKLQGFQRLRSAATSQPQFPQITIRGDNNLISLGTTGVVKVSSARAADSRLPVVPNGQWPQQILDAIRVKATKNRHSSEDVCELAGRVLGRPIVTLDRLSARDLARVYEAVCSGDWRA
jgi:hypothetical protein